MNIPRKQKITRLANSGDEEIVPAARNKTTPGRASKDPTS